jgi:IS4 transposase
MYSNKVNKDNGVLLDQIGKLTGYLVSKRYPEKLRRIRFFDEETDNDPEFLSSSLDITTEEIAQLYKYRWKVQLFFEWIKQHQVYSIIIAYCLVALVRNKLKADRSTNELKIDEVKYCKY